MTVPAQGLSENLQNTGADWFYSLERTFCGALPRTTGEVSRPDGRAINGHHLRPTDARAHASRDVGWRSRRDVR